MSSHYGASGDLSETRRNDLPSGTESFVSEETADDTCKAGDVLGGKFELTELIGSGGMGRVWSARDRLTGDEVAIKVMRPWLVSKPEARRRFTREASLALKAIHPGIVRVRDVQESAGLLYLVMEILKGETLRQKLDRTSPLEIVEALDIARQAGEALAYLHGEDVVHCDMKPENVWLGGEDGRRVKLMDFGIARAVGTTAFQRTALAKAGTAYYMAPEQRLGKEEVDGRADQFALAVVLYEMLVGEVPHGAFEPVRACRPEVTEALSAAIQKALSPRREKRYPHMEAFLAALGARKSSKLRQAYWFAPVFAIGMAFYFLNVQSKPSPEPAPARPLPTPRGVAADHLEQPASISQPKQADQLSADSVVMVKRTVPFDFNKAEPRAEGKAILDEMVEYLVKSNLRVDQIWVVGHSDKSDSPSRDYAKKLSERRANAVKSYLTGKGLLGGQIYTEGKGLEVPSKAYTKPSSESGRAVALAGAPNRRVEVEVAARREK